MINLADLQGNILRGYTNKAYVRYLILEVVERSAARRWLAGSVSGGNGVPQITSGDWGANRPETCFNIGLTYEGLRALGTLESSLQMFPNEFIEGMTARAWKLGDVGSSAPENWPEPFDKPERIHLIATIYAEKLEQLEAVQQRALADEKAFRLLGTRDGHNFLGDFVHFGYRDNIMQPRFEGIHDPKRHPDGQPMAPLGTVLLGYPTNLEGLTFRVPEPVELGHNGTFNAFRVLKQDVAGFEEYLNEAAAYLLNHPRGNELMSPAAEAKVCRVLSVHDRHGALRELVAANLCGRWRDGTPLALSPDAPDPDVSKSNFDYVGDGASRCPHGAHIRRCNPRGGQIVQRIANNSRRLVRRGMPYGPPYEPTERNSDEPTRGGSQPGPERGLLGNFIGASLGAQFEAMSCDWLNLGLQDPRITGSNDPITGANDARTSWFDLPLPSGDPIRVRRMPEFVSTRGGAYTFLPSLKAIEYLGSPM
jgi:deferrochelatase/peroxidase EfeB